MLKCVNYIYRQAVNMQTGYKRSSVLVSKQEIKARRSPFFLFLKLVLLNFIFVDQYRYICISSTYLLMTSRHLIYETYIITPHQKQMLEKHLSKKVCKIDSCMFSIFLKSSVEDDIILSHGHYINSFVYRKLMCSQIISVCC
jgi:hypothetical protein